MITFIFKWITLTAVWMCKKGIPLESRRPLRRLLQRDGGTWTGSVCLLEVDLIGLDKNVKMPYKIPYTI